MILNLLDQAGLSARIDGEYLQGGIGELQAIGAVRVMVEEADYPDANAVIQEWDANQPIRESQPSIKKKSSFGSGILGFLLGIGVMTAYYHTPVTDDGIDYNGDGNLDETWTYVNYRLSENEIDRNFDGKVDAKFAFDRKGILESSSSDEDFNGTFETEIYYEQGSLFSLKSDTTGDGFKDYEEKYRHGVLETITFIDAESKLPIKIQKFGAFKLETAEADTTGDGVMDTVYEYNSIGDIAKQYQK